MKRVFEESFVVIKTEDGYLEDAYESYEKDEDNYYLTSNPERAYRIHDENDVPKYMWDNINHKSIETVAEVCDFLKGRLVKIKIIKTTEWNEEEV